MHKKGEYFKSLVTMANIFRVPESFGLQVQSVISAELNSTTAEMFDIALTIA